MKVFIVGTVKAKAEMFKVEVCNVGGPKCDSVNAKGAGPAGPHTPG